MKNRILSAFCLLSLLFQSGAVFAFSDINQNSQFREAILYAKESGIVEGYKDGTFREDKRINRAEFLKIIIGSTLSADEIHGANCFPDVKKQWFAKYICTAKEKKIISGYPDGTFKPQDNISFVEASKIILKGFKTNELKESEIWYEPFVKNLSSKNIIPTTITSLEQEISRGEMVEMIWRILENKNTKPSIKYEHGKLITGDSSQNTNKTTIKIYPTQIEGNYQDLSGVMKSPLAKAKSGDKINLVDMYKLFGISEVRTNDDYVDNCRIYKDDIAIEKGVGRTYDGTELSESCVYNGEIKATDNQKKHHMTWKVKSSGGINNPDNYDFTDADESMKLVTDAGAKIYLRLGESWNGPNDIGNAEDSAKVSANVFKHYLGEFKPLSFSPEISAVEIHNEGNGSQFWGGDVATYHSLIKKSLEEIRKVRSDITAGGSGFIPEVVVSFNLDPSESVVPEFIKNVGPANLDFFSAHYFGYKDTPGRTRSKQYICRKNKLSKFIEWAEKLRDEIGKRGLKDKPIHITAWNIGFGIFCDKEYQDLVDANGGDSTGIRSVYSLPKMFTFTTGFLLLAQDNHLNIDHAHFYAGHGDKMTLFGLNRNGNKFLLNKALMGFYIHKQFKNTKKVKTEICESSLCKNTYNSIKDGGDLLVQAFNDGKIYKVLIINDSEAIKSIDLNLTGVKYGKIKEIKYLPPSEDRYADVQSGTGVYKQIDSEQVVSYIEDSTTTTERAVIDDSVSTELAPYSVTILEL